MIQSTRLPYTNSLKRYETDNFIFTGTYSADGSIVLLLMQDTATSLNCNGTSTFIYEFKKPVSLKTLHFNSGGVQNFIVYYWDEATSTWVSCHEVSQGYSPLVIDLDLDIPVSTRKIKIYHKYYSFSTVYWCILDYTTESATVKSAVYNTITQNELFQKATSPVEILEE